ncbi:MAG: hypothetical protein F7C35_03835 [Desulfurococcales archaeon]|nr:hypothetical protein [Desulfurococcales archaeon]
MRRNLVLISILAFLLITALPVTAENTTTNTTSAGSAEAPTLSQMVSAAMSNPETAVVMLIEFALGFALGYTAIKALKYILSFIGILVLGSALSVWSIGKNSEDILQTVKGQLQEILPLVKNLMATFSFVVVGPTSVGLILGIIFALMRK